MAQMFRLVLAMFLVASSCHSKATASRLDLGSRSTLVAGLKLEDESPNCWNSLLQLQACTGEIVLFFLNGETNLGAGCCSAIRTITEQCWPGMIKTLGFSSEEGSILEGYCDDAASSSSSELLEASLAQIPPTP